MVTERERVLEGNISDSFPRGLQSPEALHDPFEWYDEQRSESAVRYDDHRGVYDVFTYEHVKSTLQDSDRFVRENLSQRHMDTPNPFSYIDNAMVWSDGPDHKQAKGQLFQYFTPNRLRELQETIESVTASQLDIALQGGNDFDFVTEFAVPVPLRVVMRMVGIPDGDHQQVLAWLNTFREVMYSEYSAVKSKDEEAMREAVEYFEALVRRRRESPQDDLVSLLVEETELSEEEIGSNCFDFILAGQGTMSELLANALYLFEQNGMLPDIGSYDLDVVLEEVLRYRSPLQSRARKTAEPVTVDGTDIPAGETVILWIGSANHDPAVYSQSDEFVPERDPDHLAFGSGPHACIGAPLARLEAPIVLRTFLDSFAEISIDTESMEPKPKPSKLGFEHLPVRTTPR